MDALLDALQEALLAGGQSLDSRGGPSTQLEVERDLHQAGLDPSSDLVRWFEWVDANGASLDVMPDWAPMDTGESIRRWEEFVHIEEGCAVGTTLPKRYPSCLLLLQDPMGHTDNVAVAERGRGHVVFLSQVENEADPLFDSIRSMVRTLTACWDAGGYVLQDSCAAVGNAHVVARAWRAENPQVAARCGISREILGGVPLDEHEPRPSARPGWLMRLLGTSEREQHRVRNLVDVVRDVRGDGVDRRSALAKLAEQFPDQARQALPAALDDPELRGSAIVLMAELGDPDVVPAAVAMLHASVGKDVTQAINALGVAGDRSVVPRLCEIVSSGAPLAKNAAIVALERLGDPAAVAVLRPQLHSDRLSTRTLAEGALRTLGDDTVPST